MHTGIMTLPKLLAFNSRMKSDIKVTIKYLRMMKVDTDLLPLVIPGERDCLAVRSEIEERIRSDQIIDVKLTTEGYFIHLTQGLSLTIPPETNIPSHLFHSRRGLSCFSIDAATFDENENLMVIEDSATHAMLVPRNDMHILEYQRHLEATRHFWEVKNDDEE